MITHPETKQTDGIDGIAVIGMVGRFPGAPNIETFWENLRAGAECISTFTDEQLLAAGVDPCLVDSPNYVKSNFLLDGMELFDASFFGINPREAELTDPQHRIFLECAWEALEEAGYDPDQARLRIGVFAGAGTDSYFRNNVASHPELLKPLTNLQKWIASDNDYLSTRVSYKLNLKGPSLTIQTACSTSLVATHMACQSLLNFECDMALAGGSSAQVPQIAGYLYQEGSNLSSDGHCRAFDADARGMVEGSGACIVVLKRLADAMTDGDNIRAVIRGSAINNDGAVKIGYTAPSVDGQASVIAEAQALAGVSPDEVTYVETHGTGTSLGDPIEIAGLTKAFRRGTQRKGYCAIGAVKASVGHLGAAAGVTGLVKTILALQNRMLPPSVNFKRPNPGIDFENSPFYVQQTLSEWRPANGRRIAGVSAFGIGGTNAHVVVEAAPPLAPSDPPHPWQLLTISAKTGSALEKATQRLTEFLENHEDLNLADVAFTLRQGRKPLANRRVLVPKDMAEAISLLKSRTPKRVHTAKPFEGETTAAFMFPAQGAQHVNMGRGLYETEPVFRQNVDRCVEHLQPMLGLDLRKILYPEDRDADDASEQLKQTRFTQPAMFTVDYALAQLWMSLGILPGAMVGHSLGEYVAATLAGVFELKDALTLVAERGRLMQELPPGSMLAVHLPEKALQPWLRDGVSLAAVNAEELSVVAGPTETMERLAEELRSADIEVQPLRTSHAFHSAMMEPMIAPFVESVRQVARHAPKIPFVSTLTGAWITPEEAADPSYWGRQIRGAVRFSPAVLELLNTPGRVLLEVGPGNTLSTLARLHVKGTAALRVQNSLRNIKEDREDRECMLTALGHLWMAGITVDWTHLGAGERRRRVPLPTYPFERKKYWIEARQLASDRVVATSASEGAEGRCDVSREARDAGDATLEESAATQDGVSLYARPDLATQYEAPQTETEQTMAKLWRGVLGLKEVGVHDDFFELGGHSLLALTLMSQVEKIMGVRLPLASLIQAPTIRQFAQFLGEKQAQPMWSSLVPLSKAGSKPPLFLMHSHGGNVLEYEPLAHHLGKDRPVYALQARGLDGKIIPEPRVEEMASYYLKELRTVQPHGPYYLGGFCFGGFLAVEAAKQLRALGEEVPLLILINASTKEYPKFRPHTTRAHRWLYKLTYRLALEWSGMPRSPFRATFNHLLTRARRVRDVGLAQVEIELDKLQTRLHRPHSLGYLLKRLADAHDRAWAAYDLKPYDGKVLFLYARHQFLGIEPDPMLGWNGLLTGEVDVQEVPGFRQNMLDEPNVGTLAAVVVDAFDRCDKSESEEILHAMGQPSQRPSPVPAHME